jgi:hypothetical protein
LLPVVLSIWLLGILDDLGGLDVNDLLILDRLVTNCHGWQVFLRVIGVLIELELKVGETHIGAFQEELRYFQEGSVELQ